MTNLWHWPQNWPCPKTNPDPSCKTNADHVHRLTSDLWIGLVEYTKPKHGLTGVAVWLYLSDSHVGQEEEGLSCVNSKPPAANRSWVTAPRQDSSEAPSGIPERTKQLPGTPARLASGPCPVVPHQAGFLLLSAYSVPTTSSPPARGGPSDCSA